MQKAEFDKFVKEWKGMSYNSSDEKAAASTFYDEHIFPYVKKAFINNPTNRQDKKYDGLILPLGYSPEPLILSILAIDPKRVGLLYTQETERLLQRIQDETQLRFDRLYKRKIDGSSTVDVYTAIMELYEEWERPANLAVDITGGKKSMVGGAAMAAAALGADIYYVDNTKFTQGKPEPGSEYLSLLDNPYTVFGDLEVEKAKGLYDRYDYAGAARIFNELESQVQTNDLNQAKVYEAYKLLCATYEAWDNLDVGSAKTNLDQLLDILDRFRSLSGLEPLRDYKHILDKQKEALKYLEKIFNNARLALGTPGGFHFAFMLYHGALRREAQGKLDIACLLLYRLLEWISQHRLALYGIDTSEPDYSKSGLETTELTERYKEKRKIYKIPGEATLPTPIALINGFLILEALEDDIVEDLKWSALKGQVEIRNLCIYIHGMRKVSEGSLKAFKSTVEALFEKAQGIARIDADTCNEQHKFIIPLP